MHPDLLLTIVATAIAAVPTAYVVSMATRRLPRGPVRVAIRLAVVTPTAIVLGWSASSVLPLTDDGRWQCLVCAKEEHRASVAGFVYSRSALPPTDFESWYMSKIGRDHHHDWTEVGCHDRGNLVACYMEGPGEYAFASLPTWSDQSAAVALATRVLESRAFDRRAMLRAVRDDPNFAAWLEGQEDRK